MLIYVVVPTENASRLKAALIVEVSAYGGYGTTSFWEWMQSKTNR